MAPAQLLGRKKGAMALALVDVRSRGLTTPQRRRLSLLSSKGCHGESPQSL